MFLGHVHRDGGWPVVVLQRPQWSILMQAAMVNVVRWMMIGVTIMVSPLYALLVGCGWIADRMEDRR